MLISQEYVLSRREVRYEEERLLIRKYYHDQVKKEEKVLQPVYKDNTLKSFYGKP
jgi:hypothetical protein